MDMPRMTTEQSALFAEIRATILDIREMEKAMSADDYREGLEEPHGQAPQRLEELAQRIPRPARSLVDLIMLAGVVWAHDDKNEDGSLDNLEHGCPDERARALLVEAVHDLFGIRYS
jgi:hypothetical protein